MKKINIKTKLKLKLIKLIIFGLFFSVALHLPYMAHSVSAGKDGMSMNSGDKKESEAMFCCDDDYLKLQEFTIQSNYHKEKFLFSDHAIFEKDFAYENDLKLFIDNKSLSPPENLLLTGKIVKIE